MNIYVLILITKITTIIFLRSGWCFLEHVSNPNDPSEDCFEDTTWSPTNGRFYSNFACGGRPDYDEPIPPPGGVGGVPPPTFDGTLPPPPPLIVD